MLVTAAIVTALLATTSVAYSLHNAGFSATHYATGFAVGPRASAWDGNVLWIVDASDGLYKADAGLPGPGPLTSISATRANATAVAGYTGIAVGLDGRLYASSTATGDVVELDKTDGHIIRTLSHNTGVNPRAIAIDPLSGDLFVAGSARIWRISMPGLAPVVSIYSKIASGLGSKAIAIGPDGRMFVVTDTGLLYTVESTVEAALHPGDAVADPMGAPVPGIAGVSVITNGVSPLAQFLLVTTDGGAVYKVSGIASTVAPILVLDGAGAGQQISTGPDRCAYPAMGTEVLRVADATGTCALALAGVIPPTLALDTNAGPAPTPHVGNAITVRASLSSASTPAGHDITFTTTGVNPGVHHATTDSGGNAQFSYTSAVAGIDTIVASATVDGFPLASNPVVITWLPPIDTATPTIGFSYTVPSGGQGTNFSCNTATTSDTSSVVTCGWFTQYPTIHFDLTPNGTSGLGLATNCADFTLNYQPGPEGHHQTCTVLNGDGQAQATFTVIINAVVSPPTITASATANGSPYVAGSLTKGPVTVHFTCSSPIPTALQCPADQTFSGTGTFTASGTAVDIAGQTATATFAVNIDATPPVVTVDSAPYTFGAWTNGDVHLVFHCTDNVAVGTCPGPQTIIASTPGVTVSATDTAGNTTTFTTGAINIDRTPPTITATAKTTDGHVYVAGTLTNQDVTVHYSCGTDAAPVTSCAADQVFHASGSATGSATDAAGNIGTATFGPIVIDRTAPTIAATLTVSGSPYDGSWTRGPVLVHFTCADDNAGVICPADILLTADRNAPVSGTATDAAGNTANVTTAAIKIDRTAPVTTANVTGTSAGTPNTYLFTANVALSATDTGSGVASLTYRIDGGAPTTVSGATASLPFSTEGAHTVTFHATDTAGNVESDHTVSFSIIFRQHTTLAITSDPFVATDGLVSARLLTDAGVPVAGETLGFTACGVTRTATTDATGTARIDLGLASGACTLTATFAGSTPYFPSSATAQPITVFAMTKFVVWSPNAVPGATVQFYGGDWSKQITDKDARKGFSDFKGYAENVYPTYWTARPGDAVKPAKTIPQYIGVILTNSASKTKDVITGDNAGIAIIKVTGDDPDKKKDKAYDGKLGDAGFGTVLAVVRR